MTRNEAAERLLYDLADITEPDGWDKRVGLIDEALAAERRATVERIRERYLGAVNMPDAPLDEPIDVLAILDGEAAR